MRTTLSDIPVDPAYLRGARNAVEVCLRIAPAERVALITDEATSDIMAAIEREVRAAGAPYRLFVLEDFGPRPHADLPSPILDALRASEVSIYAAQGQSGELRTRMQMTGVVTERRIRHGHMININRQIMLEGMQADFHEVDEISTRVWNLAREARRIRATSPSGTDITAELSPHLRWLKTSGIIQPEKWGNLPGGEVFTAPAEVNGTFVVDGVVGDYLCAKYGDLAATPLRIEVKGSRIASIESSHKELEKEFWAYTHTDENSDRVGEFAIGTNIQLDHVIGHILQDEKIPGVHIAFGYPYCEHTGATWTSSTHIDVVGTKFDIWIDEKKVMSEGVFTL